MSETYQIVRFRFNGPREVRRTGLTLEEAQEHCQDPESSSTTTTTDDEPGQWFDGYEVEVDR